LAALVVSQVDALVDAHAGKPVKTALADTAVAISEHPVRAALARIEPAVLTAIARIDDTALGWQHAAAAVGDLLARESRDGAPLVLRWLASFLLSPAKRAAIVADVELLLAALPVVEPPAAEVARPA
jgi:hypothetical protein